MEVPDKPQNFGVEITREFKSENIGNKLLVLENVDVKSANLTAIKQTKSAQKTISDGTITLGEYHTNPSYWYYISIKNATNHTRKMVIEESIHLRCDALEIYDISTTEIKNIGEVNKTTPLSKRAISMYVHALPLTIRAHDTIHILIHTKRKHGVHQVKLNIFDYDFYITKLINIVTIKLINIILLSIISIVILILGIIFYDKKMLLFGLYISMMTISLCCFFGFFDWIQIYPDFSIGSTSIFIGIINAFYHPYGYAFMKPVPKNEKWFNFITIGLFISNVALSCCFFLPQPIFFRIDRLIVFSFFILIFAQIIWITYSSLLAWRKNKINYHFIAISIAFSPFIVFNLFDYFTKQNLSIYLSIDVAFWFSSMISISIICIFTLREKLISRKNYDKNLDFIRTTMEDIRKTEVGIIGRNLHDNVGNILASALGYLNLKEPPTDTLRSVLFEAIKEIRFLSHNLVKNDHLPISLKLSRLAERFDEFSSIRFTYFDFTKKQIDVRLNENRQQNLYYIVQELFTNLVKHSEAKEVSMQIFQDEEKSWVVIEDDGIGWDFNSVPTQGGIGLKNIQQRANLAQFDILFDSTSNGTNIIIEITS